MLVCDRIHDLLNSTEKSAESWRAASRAAPLLLTFSGLGLLLTYFFFTLNLQAIAAGVLAGFASALGYFGLAIRSNRVQMLSLVILVVSVLVFPYTPKATAGMVMLTGFIAGVCSYSLFFLIVSVFLRLIKKARVSEEA